MKVYLAGSLRVYPDATASAEDLRNVGFEVFPPTEYDEGDEFAQRAALRSDLDFICTVAEAVILMPRWLNSLGARAAVATAKALAIPVFGVETAVSYGPGGMRGTFPTVFGKGAA